jgi:hypothetical protein
MWSTLLNTDPYASVQIAGIYASHQTNGSHLVTNITTQLPLSKPNFRFQR